MTWPRAIGKPKISARTWEMTFATMQRTAVQMIFLLMRWRDEHGGPSVSVNKMFERWSKKRQNFLGG